MCVYVQNIQIYIFNYWQKWKKNYFSYQTLPVFLCLTFFHQSLHTNINIYIYIYCSYKCSTIWIWQHHNVKRWDYCLRKCRIDIKVLINWHNFSFPLNCYSQINKEKVFYVSFPCIITFRTISSKRGLYCCIALFVKPNSIKYKHESQVHVNKRFSYNVNVFLLKQIQLQKSCETSDWRFLIIIIDINTYYHST